jgi:NAD+ synthase
MHQKPSKLTLLLAQLNTEVGNFEKNFQLIVDALSQAKEGGADIVITPELALCGYPPMDQVLSPSFIDAAKQKLELLRPYTENSPAILVGTPWMENGQLYNACVLIQDGKVTGIQYKHHLPNYGVFDEQRTFSAGTLPSLMSFNGLRFGVMICEDIWEANVASHLLEQGADVLIVMNASPFTLTKFEKRLDIARIRVKNTNTPIVYCNQVGGQDELVFDGGSFGMMADGTIINNPIFWKESYIKINFDIIDNNLSATSTFTPILESYSSKVYNAMVLGLRDYTKKNNFKKVILGMSGGIDSALTAAVAVDALGAENVMCVMLPTQYTSQDSLEDAKLCEELLGISKTPNINIINIVKTIEETLSPIFQGLSRDVTEENIQARTRGLILMALSNKLGYMLLTTGNKSEVAVGYATLYGDMCGSYSVLKDLYKTKVFEVVRWRNQLINHDFLGPKGMVIPNQIIEKAPTAELRENQKDEDSLPPYTLLDQILEGLIENGKSSKELIDAGFDEEVVKRVVKLLFRSEYKRFQAAPGVKLTDALLGYDRRFPITNSFLDKA